jgi:hypothetical protein
MSLLLFIINTWHDISDINIFPTYLSVATKEVGGSKAYERCSKDCIQNKLSQNSVQSMSFLLYIINTWHDISDINIFPTYLSIAKKEVGGDEVRPKRGAPKTV